MIRAVAQVGMSVHSVQCWERVHRSGKQWKAWSCRNSPSWWL